MNRPIERAATRGRARRAAHAGLEGPVADADGLLANERGAWCRESVGHPGRIDGA